MKISTIPIISLTFCQPNVHDLESKSFRLALISWRLKNDDGWTPVDSSILYFRRDHPDEMESLYITKTQVCNSVPIFVNPSFW